MQLTNNDHGSARHWLVTKSEEAMKTIAIILALTCLPLGGCALVAAGVIGGAIVAHNDDYYGGWHGRGRYRCPHAPHRH